MKSKSEDEEFLRKRKEIIKRLIKECVILHGFTQNTIEYVEDNVVYLEFGFKNDEHKFRLLKSKSEDEEFLRKRKEIIKRLIKECVILHVRDRWWLK